MIALLYHDVVPETDFEASGFPGGGAARYKLTRAEFSRHLDQIEARGLRAEIAPTPDLPTAPSNAFLLTFDDGGASAHDCVADMLESRGWRGYFLITADYLDTPGFVTTAQARVLASRGHVIGSHSCTHPPRMSYCGWDQLVDEWHRSQHRLADAIGAPVTVASVPGGFYSRQVADAADRSGLKLLFTSEPTARTWQIGGCRVAGRYTVYRGMSAQTAAALAAGTRFPALRQAASWKVRKLAKTLGGSVYLKIRSLVLERQYAARAAR